MNRSHYCPAFIFSFSPKTRVPGGIQIVYTLCHKVFPIRSFPDSFGTSQVATPNTLFAHSVLADDSVPTQLFQYVPPCVRRMFCTSREA